MTRYATPTPREPRRIPPTEAVVIVTLLLGAAVSTVALLLLRG